MQGPGGRVVCVLGARTLSLAFAQVCVCVCVCVCVGVLGGLAPSLAFAQGLHTCSHSLSDAKCDRQPPVEQASPDIPLAGPGPAAAPERKPFPDLSSPLARPG